MLASRLLTSDRPLPLKHHALSALKTLLFVALALGGATSARAQLFGGAQNLPGARGLPHVQTHGIGMPGISSIQRTDNLLRDPQALTRKLQIATLLREHPGRVGVDSQGSPIVVGAFLAMNLSDVQISAVQALGFVVDRDAPAEATLGLDLLVLRDTRGRSASTALRQLQQQAPHATFAYQHIYLPAGGGIAPPDTNSATGPGSAIARSIGLIDGGVDPAETALAHARIERFGCTTASISRHGTAVAARLIDGDNDTLYAANLWCDGAIGGVTSSLVDALAWMARERVPVINISLVGPDNPVLASAVTAMIARGHVIVSAVGNDGPAAPPLFPAAYPDVLGVSAVDARDHVLPESGSGDDVAFSALGLVGRGRSELRGTSFAAPIVARRAAQLLSAPRSGAAAEVKHQLAGEARDLGPTGWDPRYGYGVLSP